MLKAKYSNIHQNLIEECKVGSKKAQFEIYRLYYQAMYNVSLRIVNDTQDAEDIMQEAFLSAFDKLPTYSETVSFGAWLKRIVVNLSIDYLRKKKISFDDIDSISQISFDDTETESYENTQEKIERIRNAMKQLSNKYRTIISLYLFEGYDHDEIAEILGVTPSTSRSQLTRAKQKLLSLLMLISLLISIWLKHY